MEVMLAIAIGLLSSCGVYLMLRARTFPVILGLTLLSYAVNLFLFASGRLVVNAPPIISAGASHYTDPIPQALVLTAIVIGFGMTAYIVTLALRGLSESGGDHVDMPHADNDSQQAFNAEGSAPPTARQEQHS